MNTLDKIAQATVETLRPAGDGERVTLFNIIRASYEAVIAASATPQQQQSSATPETQRPQTDVAHEEARRCWEEIRANAKELNAERNYLFWDTGRAFIEDAIERALQNTSPVLEPEAKPNGVSASDLNSAPSLQIGGSTKALEEEADQIFEDWWATYAGPFVHKSGAKFSFTSGFLAALRAGQPDTQEQKKESL